VALAFVCFS